MQNSMENINSSSGLYDPSETISHFGFIMSTLPPLPPDIVKIAGPLLIAHILHVALFGVLSVQVYIYYLAFPLEPLNRKALVYIIYIAELIQAILMAKMAFKEFAVGFGNILALDEISLLWFAVPLISSVVAAVVQTFYAYRIKMFADSIVIPVLVVLIALIQLGGGVALSVFAEQQRFFSKLLGTKTLVAAGIWNAGSALCDVIIAASMTYYLSNRKSQWRNTQRRVQKLTHLVLETGMLTAAIAVINLALFLIPSHRSYYQTTSAVLGKMYSTTMMVVLNSRIEFSRHDTTVASTELSSISRQDNRRRPVISTVRSGAGITVTREQWSDPLDEYKLPDTKEVANFPNNVRSASNA